MRMQKPRAATPLRRSLVVLGGVWVCMLALGGLLNPDDDTWFAILTVVSIGLSAYLVAGAGWMSLALIASFALRIVVLWIDLYTDIPVFSSGGDTENYYMTALLVYAQPELFGANLYGGLFPQLCGALFWVIGPSRIFIQYTNVLLSVAALALTGASMVELKVPVRIARGVLLVVGLMPIGASIAAIFLREALIVFLLAAATFAFCRWLRGGSILTIALALALVAAASTFHLGALGAAVGMGFALLFFDRRTARVSFSISSLLRGVPVIGVAVFVIAAFPSLFLEKLEGVSSAEDALAIATGSFGASAYLTNLTVDSPGSFLAFGGLKALYLLISPVPLDWRGANDVISFALDGAFFLVAILIVVSALVGRVRDVRRRYLAVVAATAVSTVLVLGMGTSAAGTAMRHREKALPVIALSVGLALSVRQQRKGVVENLPLPTDKQETVNVRLD